MSKFTLNISYTKQKENTELDVEVNFESSEKQNDQSPKGMLGLILDYASLAANLFSIVPVIMDTLSNMI